MSDDDDGSSLIARRQFAASNKLNSRQRMSRSNKRNIVHVVVNVQNSVSVRVDQRQETAMKDVEKCKNLHVNGSLSALKVCVLPGKV